MRAAAATGEAVSVEKRCLAAAEILEVELVVLEGCALPTFCRPVRWFELRRWVLLLERLLERSEGIETEEGDEARKLSSLEAESLCLKNKEGKSLKEILN